MATLERRLGLWSSIGLVIGITIGGGIFRTPAGIASRVPEPMLMLGVWVLGGIIVMCGALAFAELSASMPETGGMYVYLREGWGRPYAFLFGWSQLVLIRAAALGGISSVFGEYFLRNIGSDPDRKSTRLNSSHVEISYAVFCCRAPRHSHSFPTRRSSDLAFAELSASMPETGGMYVYLREGWGRPYAFLFGWSQLVLIRAAALGGISSVFGEYFLRNIGSD